MQGRILNFFARGGAGGGGGQRGEAFICMVWGWLRNIAQKMYPGSGASPQPLLTVIGAFYIISAT